MTSFQIGGLVSSWYSGGWNWWDVAQDGLFMPLVVILYVLFGFLSGQSDSPTPFLGKRSWVQSSLFLVLFSQAFHSMQ